MTTGRSNISQLSQSRRVDLPEASHHDAGDDNISVYSENASVRSGSLRSGSVRSIRSKSRSDALSEAGSAVTASTRHTVVSEARSEALSDHSRCHRLSEARQYLQRVGYLVIAFKLLSLQVMHSMKHV